MKKNAAERQNMIGVIPFDRIINKSQAATHSVLFVYFFSRVFNTHGVLIILFLGDRDNQKEN